MNDTANRYSRREVLGRLGVGIAAAAASPILQRGLMPADAAALPAAPPAEPLQNCLCSLISVPNRAPRSGSSEKSRGPDSKVPRIVVHFERFLWRAGGFGHVLQVEPNARPAGATTSHRVNQDVVRLKHGPHLGVPRSPALEAIHSFPLGGRAGNFDQRRGRSSATGRPDVFAWRWLRHRPNGRCRHFRSARGHITYSQFQQTFE